MALEDLIHISGLERVTNKKFSELRRSTWALLVAAGLIFLIYHLAERINYYKADPAFTRVDISRPESLQLPGVTICLPRTTNKYVATCKKVNGFNEIGSCSEKNHALDVLQTKLSQDKKADVDEKESNSDKNYTDIPIIQANITSQEQRSLVQSLKPIHEFPARLKYDDNLDMIREIQQNPSFTNQSKVDNESQSASDSSTSENMTISGFSKEMREFFENRNCKRFNTEIKQSATRTGVFESIEIEVGPPAPKYMAREAAQAPAKVKESYINGTSIWLHLEGNSSAPISTSTYIQLSMGQEMNIGISMINRTFYKNCNKKPLPNGQKYNQELCQVACLEQYIKTNCRCQPDGVLGLFRLTENNQPCITRTAVNCKNEILHRLLTNTSSTGKGWIKTVCAHCLKPCEEISLEQEIYSTIILKARFEIDFDKAIARIYYKSMFVTHVDEEKSYGWLTLLCDFGGAMGVIIGGCIFSLLQVIDFLLFDVMLSNQNREQINEKEKCDSETKKSIEPEKNN